MGGNRRLEFRLDVFNVFNTVIYTNRQSQIQYNSPTDLTIRNSQTLANGQLDPARLVPRNAGFGAATGAQRDAQRCSCLRAVRVLTLTSGAGPVRPCARRLGHSARASTGVDARLLPFDSPCGLAQVSRRFPRSSVSSRHRRSYPSL